MVPRDVHGLFALRRMLAHAASGPAFYVDRVNVMHVHDNVVHTFVHHLSSFANMLFPAIEDECAQHPRKDIMEMENTFMSAHTAQNITPPLLQAGSRWPVRNNWRPMHGASETSENC